MRLLRAAQIEALDAAAAAAGTPPEVLMGRAGRAVADAVGRLQPKAQRIVVLAGSGNNGGDGYVAAALLHERGLGVTVLCTGDEPRRPAARSAFERWRTLSPPLAAESPEADVALAHADLVIDALFGVGIRPPLPDTLLALFKRVRESGAPVLAVDVPSGLHADHAESLGPVLTATWTLQLAAAKPASLLPPARERYGAWSVDDLGLDPALLERFASAEAFGRTRAAHALPRRRSDSHKYRAGALVVWGGSARFAGAAELAARAALRAGAGYVTLASDHPHPARWPELVWCPTSDLHTAPGQVLLVGPGLEMGAERLARHLGTLPQPYLVLDGGALHPHVALREPKRGVTRVLTPHAGEAGRLLGMGPSEVARDPLAAASTLAKASGSVVVLKGPATVIAAPGRRPLLVPGGPAALAVAGSGDVLAGIIAALLAADAGDRRPPHTPRATLDLVAAAVVMHAESARIALERFSHEGSPPSGGLIPQDLIDALPRARAELELRRTRAP
jgi:ADP-dependent NAD(P)H-hydrate dehydratase / NAD(P)H-hydrate epimerase